MRGNVLFVEDEQALQMTVGDRLRNEGYAVDYAANGDEGFEKATQLPFDLIILDVMLPKRDGFNLCKGIREAGLITPILMLTARGQTSDKVNGLKIGGDAGLMRRARDPVGHGDAVDRDRLERELECHRCHSNP